MKRLTSPIRPTDFLLARIFLLFNQRYYTHLTKQCELPTKTVSLSLYLKLCIVLMKSFTVEIFQVVCPDHLLCKTLYKDSVL